MGLARSVSLPERPKPAAISSDAGKDKATKHAKRSLSVSFAPAPLDDAFEAPASPGIDVVALDTPSISAVARNFGVLAKRYQDASVAQRSGAFQALTASGSRMFADFLSRDAKLDIDLAWDAKSHRTGARQAGQGNPAPASILGELANLSSDFNSEASQVYGFANARRTLLGAEMKQLLQCVAEQHDLVHNPALQGILVGCVLDGAMHALFTHDTTQAKKSHAYSDYLRVKGSVLALCHAVEEVFSVRFATKPQASNKPALERAKSWNEVLVREPERVIERCARTVSANPRRYSGKSTDKIEFQMLLRRTRSAGYGERCDPEI
jgi:hypothetical protein